MIENVIIKQNSMEDYSHHYSHQHRLPAEHSIFVGCLDPATTKNDIISYFKMFDKGVKAKLIVNFKTGQSKQCALVFCSSQEVCQEILKHEHYLHERRLRLDYAQDEFKGKKADQLAAIQISGLDPETTQEELLSYFEQVHGFRKVRLIKGLHPKQKKVAVLYFADRYSAQEVLNQSHLKIGKRNCKVTEYSKDKPLINQSMTYESPTQNVPKPIMMSFNPPMYHDLEACSPQMYSTGPQSISSFGSPSYRGGASPGTEGPRRIAPLKLNPGFLLTPTDTPKSRPEDAFVHPVEVQDDDLFRIFCDSAKIKNKPVYIPQHVPAAKVKIAESNETAAE